MEEVFRALADPSRRLLLDRLVERDGQTLGELCTALPAMTRFGVMKHLDVLETAGLVITRRHGREKLHYLNPVPIRLVHDRWISKFQEPFVRAMSRLKNDLEGEHEMAARPVFVHEILIQASPERVWQALTDPAFTERYYYGSRVRCDAWVTGARYAYEGDGGVELITGDVLEADPPRRLSMSFGAQWDPEVAGDAPSRVTFDISPVGRDAVRLTCTHDGFEGETGTYRSVAGGWPLIVSGLKTLLETGTPLVVGA